MIKLTPSARDLIAEARDGDEPTSAARARVRAKLLARIGAGAVTGATAGSATAAGTATKMALSTGLLVKLLGAVCVAGAIAAGALATRQASEPAKEAASVVVTTPPLIKEHRLSGARDAPAATDASIEARAKEPAATTSDAPRPSAMRASPSAPPALREPPRQATSSAIAGARAADGSLEGETELLRKAQTELREGRPERALAALDAHGAEFKDGILREERLAARILALCDLGRTSAARAEAQRFLARSPRSPMAERIRNSCGGEASR